MKTKVVNIRKEPWDVDISRRGRFGNPYRVGPDGTREEVIEKHMRWLQWWIQNKKEIVLYGAWSNKWQVEHLHLLEGKRIACYCTPLHCHGDNYVKLLHSRRKHKNV